MQHFEVNVFVDKLLVDKHLVDVIVDDPGSSLSSSPMEKTFVHDVGLSERDGLSVDHRILNYRIICLKNGFFNDSVN